MTKNDYLEKIAELAAQIDLLPKGYISKKAINDQIYFYHQWSENGVKHSRYIRDEELEELSAEIDKRKELQNELKAVKAEIGNIKINSQSAALYCTLMHKRTAVADLELDNDTGVIQKIIRVYSVEHIPVGVTVRHNLPDKKALNDWWTDRSIPSSRSGIREALETLEIANTKMLLIRCYGLSLSDQYWICPEGSGLSWDDINFFTNGFSDDIGDVLFGSDKKPDPLNFSSPDNTSDGNLKKRWKIINGKRCLIKGGSNPYRQQPFNEVIASEIMKRLKIRYVPYSIMWNKGAPNSICEDFVDEYTELIPAWRIIKVQKKSNNTSIYQHFVKCAEELGIPDVIPFIDRMIVLDYIIANEDRHLNNFGALRNAETLEWIGMAPIYDSGSSLGYDKIPALMKNRDEVICKPFKKHHDEQLKLVTSFDWIDFEALSDIHKTIMDILSDDNAKDYMDSNRIKTIADLTEKRIENLRIIASSKTSEAEVTTQDDITENIAAEYS